MNVLVACEFSGIVRRAFEDKGHNAWSCDILPTQGNNNKHFHCDIKKILYNDWDLMIAHPPCTFLCNSGVSWLHKDDSRWSKLKKAWKFFNILKDAPIDKICVENPIPHKYAKEHIGKYDQLIQPYQFGHMERKATCLWLKNLPKLEPTNNVYEEMKKLPKNQQQRLHYLPPSKNRGMERSITFKGIADAMADQWG